MKRRVLIILISILTSFLFINDVDALSGKLVVKSNKSTVTAGSSFVVTVTYNGNPVLGSLTMGTTMTNATCTVKSKATGATDSCSNNKCEINYFNATGYKSGTKLLELTCKSTASNATISAYSIGGDAFDVEGIEEITLSQGSVTVKVNATTKKTTTTKKKTTTAKTTTSTTTTTTTSLIENTTSIVDMTTTTTSSTKKLTEPITSNIDHIADDYKLSSLKIVGYDIDFNKNKTGYKINVPEQIDELYVIAEAIDPTNKIDNAGIVNIAKDNYFVIRVYNDDSSTEVLYKVEISRESNTASVSSSIITFISDFALVFVVIVVIICAIVIASFLLRKKQKKEDKMEVDEYAVPPMQTVNSNYYNQSEVYSSNNQPNIYPLNNESALNDAGIRDISDNNGLTKVNINNKE